MKLQFKKSEIAFLAEQIKLDTIKHNLGLLETAQLIKIAKYDNRRIVESYFQKIMMEADEVANTTSVDPTLGGGDQTLNQPTISNAATALGQAFGQKAVAGYKAIGDIASWAYNSAVVAPAHGFINGIGLYTKEEAQTQVGEDILKSKGQEEREAGMAKQMTGAATQYAQNTVKQAGQQAAEITKGAEVQAAQTKAAAEADIAGKQKAAEEELLKKKAELNTAEQQKTDLEVKIKLNKAEARSAQEEIFGAQKTAGVKFESSRKALSDFFKTRDKATGTAAWNAMKDSLTASVEACRVMFMKCYDLCGGTAKTGANIFLVGKWVIGVSFAAFATIIAIKLLKVVFNLLLAAVKGVIRLIVGAWNKLLGLFSSGNKNPEAADQIATQSFQGMQPIVGVASRIASTSRNKEKLQSQLRKVAKA